MNYLILQIIFVLGITYGVISLFIEIKKQDKKNKYQVMLSIIIIGLSALSFYTSV